MFARALRYAGYAFVWPFATAVTYSLCGGGTIAFVVSAAGTLLAAIVLGSLIAHHDSLEGCLVLILGWGATVALIMHATWPRWVTPFELPAELISVMLRTSTVVLGLNALFYLTKRALSSPLGTPFYLARGYYLLFFGGPNAS
jgi:hypothetical protein